MREDMTRTVVRDRAWIEREYDSEKWPALLRHVDALIAAGETSLSRVLTLVEWERQRKWTQTLGTQTPGTRGLAGADAFDLSVYGRRATLPFGCVFEGQQALIARAVGEACTPQTGAIVELGSGIGKNLCWTWLLGGPRDVPYYALEYTAAGRACSQRLADLAPELELIVQPFDFHAATLDGVHVRGDHAVVFTAQSIEQIPDITEAAMRPILDLAPRVTCLHFEPVGWQMAGHAPMPGATSSRAHAEAHDYNRNLWAVLQGLERDGALSITRSIPDLYGVVPDNSVALVEWQKG